MNNPKKYPNKPALSKSEQKRTKPQTAEEQEEMLAKIAHAFK